MPRRLPAAISLLSLAVLVFLAGMAAAHLNLAPYRYARFYWNRIEASFDVPDRLMPRRYDIQGAQVHDRAAMAPGTTFLTSYFPEFDWNAGARLIDADGRVLHRWPVDPATIFDRKVRLPYIHGSYLFPNGDILVSFEFIGLARISACGEERWHISDPVTHHSVAIAEDGSFWVSANRTLTSRAGRSEALVRALSLPVYEDLLLHVSADGDILQEISTLDVLDRNGLGDTVIRMAKKNLGGDLTHMNDVEPLPAAMAAEYPMFEAGDLAVSLRDLEMVLVMDPRTLKVKWFTVTDTLGQHDADFIGQGWIGIFDNRFDGSETGEVLGGSRILAIRPETGERKVLFPTPASPPFSTKWSGKWQLLPNGNLLLTEARAGRALEVTAGGAPVWDWTIEPYDDKRVPELMEATRYPYTAEDVAAWPCN